MIRSAAIGLSWCLLGCATVVPGTYPGDREIWQGLVAGPETLQLPGRPVAVVAPHHLIDGFELGSFWKAIASIGPVPVIVVVGPDHHAEGGGDMTIGDRLQYQTVFGPLAPDSELVGQLRDLAPVTTRDAAFVSEHSIHAHGPFIKRNFPDARFVPVIVRWGSAPATLEQLAVALDKVLPADSLVVASVDFSHFQGQPWATFHDEAAWSTISGFDTHALFDREVDSPESLFVAMRFAAMRGAKKATKVLHTNSQTHRSVFVPDSTSHLYVTFTRGEPAPMPTVNVLFTGEVAAWTGLRFRDSWRWHSFEPDAVPALPMLAKIRGQEDRFFMGADAFVFRLEPGERVERTINGIHAAFAAVSLSQIADPESTVRTLKGTADCLFLLAFRGALPAEPAAAIARALSEAGSDIVVGRGFGAPVPLELRDGRLVALSLGDFLPEGLTSSEGTALGVTWSRSEVRARTVPLKLVKSVPHVDLDRLAEALGYPVASGDPQLQRE